MLRLHKILMNKAGDPGGSGAPKDPPTPPVEPSKVDPPAKSEDGKEYDELGYEIVKKEGDPPAKPDDKKKDPPKVPEKVENPATGYGDEPPKVDDPPPKENEPPKDPPTDLEKKLEGLHKSFAERVKAQITDLGLEGDKLDKFIALKKQEQKDAEDYGKKQAAEFTRQEQIRKAGWHKELKEDPVFGKEKYPVNIARSEKVLDEYLPELKKELTDAKQVLRPSVMRGLARLADQLYPDDKMVQGDPPGAEDDKEADKKSNDPLAFYE